MKVYVLGDSISIQYGPFLEKFLGGIMEYSRKEGVEEALLNLDKPQGANGGDSSMVLSFLQACAAAGGIDADVMLLNCGLHDLRTDPKTGAKQVPIDRYRENLQSIIQVVATMRPQLVWLRSTPIDEALHNSRIKEFKRYTADGLAYNEAADEVMARAGIATIDLYNFTLKLGPDLYCDHAHYHEHIREKQAAVLAGWLAAWKTNNPLS